MTSFYLNYPIKDPMSKYSHTLRARNSVSEFDKVGDTIQLITVAPQKIFQTLDSSKLARLNIVEKNSLGAVG